MIVKKSADQDKFIGMWVTKDGVIRHQLLPGGRYDEARSKKASAYQGRYWLEGDHIEYVDDTGFTADGKFRDGVLYHAGMILYRNNQAPMLVVMGVETPIGFSSSLEKEPVPGNRAA